MDQSLVEKDIEENIYMIQKRISIVFSVSGFGVILINLLLSLFVSKLGLHTILTDISIYLTLLLTIPFIVFSFIKKSSVIVQYIQVLVLFSAFFASAWDQYNSIYALTFSILAVSLMYKYKMLEKHLIWKIIIIYSCLICIIAFSSFNAGRSVAGLQVVLFMTFFLFVSYLIFKSELDKMISNEKRMENEILDLVKDRESLKETIERNQKQFNELEKQYLEYKNKKKPFDFDKYHLTPSEINVIKVLVEQRASNKEISEELNIKESTVKQHLYRIYNKIGVDNRIQLIDLCEYNF
jgi:DNA-binding CsgD family transcriptional regulator